MADLCTLAQVKARLKVTNAADDALIDELIDNVSDWIEDFTRRKLTPESAQTYVVDTSAGSVILVPRGIRAVTTLSIAATDQPDTGGVYTAVAAADVLIRPSSMDRRPGWPGTSILIRGSYPRLRAALNGASILGDFGFNPTPPRVVEVAIDAVVTAFVNRGRPAGGVIGEGDTPVYPWATYFSSGSPQRATLERFRVPGIG